MKTKIGIGDVDSVVLKAMVAQGRMNQAAKEDGAFDTYCCACRGMIKTRGAKPGKDLQNSRAKLIEDKWTPIKTLRDNGWSKNVFCELCEVCNWDHFTPDGVNGIKWRGPTS